MQRVYDMASVMSKEPAAPIVVVSVAGIAEVRDGFVGTCRIFTGDHVRFAERHGDHATRTEAVAPIEPQIRLMRDGIEATAGGHGDVAWLKSGGYSHITKLNVIPRTTIAVHPTTELLSPRSSLHHPPAHFTVSNLADA